MPDFPLTAAKQWYIQLFDALDVSKPTGESVPLSGKKAGELLAYLALYPHQAHTRDKLTTLLWGDTEVSHARTRLRQEIGTLRALFPATSDYPPLLLITPENLQIQSSVVIDAVRFLEACSEAKRTGDWDKKICLLHEARDLYRVDLLTEYSTPWVVAERVRFSECYEQMLCDLAEAYRQRQDEAGVEEALRCLVTHNPLKRGISR